MSRDTHTHTPVASEPFVFIRQTALWSGRFVAELVSSALRGPRHVLAERRLLVVPFRAVAAADAALDADAQLSRRRGVGRDGGGPVIKSGTGPERVLIGNFW